MYRCRSSCYKTNFVVYVVLQMKKYFATCYLMQQNGRQLIIAEELGQNNVFIKAPRSLCRIATIEYITGERIMC